jgi:isochorismate synthase
VITFAAHAIVVSRNGQRAADALHRAVPFCICRLPGSSDTRFYTSMGTPEAGALVVQPWKHSKYGKSRWLYRAEDPRTAAAALANRPERVHYQPLPDETTHGMYRLQFAAYQDAFKTGKVRKAILSRVKKVQRPAFFEPLTFFATIASQYPDAFTWLLYHPELGMWAGATPELLLSKRGLQYRTVSLAGTMRANAWHTYKWGEKELQEQELVSKHIRRALREAAIENWRETGPRNRVAGNAVHLETIFEWSLDAGIDFIEYLLSDLHPTPAVAGLPANEAAQFIAATERHDRGLYTGYIGTLDLPFSAELFVNLRCMQIGERDIALYVGGGITPQSVLEAEWEETELKAHTLETHIHG